MKSRDVSRWNLKVTRNAAKIFLGRGRSRLSESLAASGDRHLRNDSVAAVAVVAAVVTTHDT